MKITLICAMRCEEKTFPVDTEKVTAETTIGSLIRRPWVTQQNGENFDIYCCAGCAK